MRAAEALERDPRISTYNVGRGAGSSVLDVLKTVHHVTGRPLAPAIVERRPGDPARIVGRVDRIARDLGWTARRDLHDMVASAWKARHGSGR